MPIRKAKFMKLICLALLTLVMMAFSNHSQESKPTEAETMARLSLISDLQTLLARAKRLQEPLARALVEAEIADAAWAVDRELAKELLREAYKMTLSTDNEPNKPQKVSIGESPGLPSSLDRARRAVRQRVLQVANRDKTLANELVEWGTSQVGTFERQVELASLARDAMAQGEDEAAIRYIRQAIDADPTQLAPLSAIEQLAGKNRAAADAVILHYITLLSATSLSSRDGSIARTNLFLGRLIYPSAHGGNTSDQISQPGPAVMKAYVEYVLNSLAALEQKYPGFLLASRSWLLNTYPILKQYAPELTQQFLDLEQRSRKPGENFSLPTPKRMEEEYKAKYDKQVERELESDHPDDVVIQRVISAGDFSKARKMIDRLSDGPKKAELNELLNAQQAISLANKGDIPDAQKLAESLVKASSILRVFPVIAGKCVADNDDQCARDTVNQAVKQLKKADPTPFSLPPGVPASVMGTSKDFDPVLNGLSGLASAVIPVKDELALDVLDELVIAANHSELDMGLGRTGFETSLFKKLAEKNEARVNLAAMQLKDPLRQILALAAIDQWKSDKLAAEAKLRSAKNESTGKKN